MGMVLFQPNFTYRNRQKAGFALLEIVTKLPNYHAVLYFLASVKT